MADQRNGGIAWSDETWNPVRGCSRVSPGCVNCYAERQAARFSGPGQPYEGLVRIHTRAGPETGGERPLAHDDVKLWEPRHREPRWTGVVRLVPEHLADPLRWRRPRRVFVNSMSDLFHETLSDEDIAAVFGVIAVAGGAFHGPSDGHDLLGKPFPLAPGSKPVQMRMPRARHGPHAFQILTKRAKRMRDLLTSNSFRGLVAAAAYRRAMDRTCAGGLADDIEGGLLWPLPNVWLGVSVEDQKRADERIPELLATPAAVRWVSYEPAIEAVEFQRDRGWLEPFQDVTPMLERTPRISWLVVGGESGPGARPFDLEWARSTIAQCREAGVSCFFKQGGGSNRCSHDGKGGHLECLPEDLRVREFPNAVR